MYHLCKCLSNVIIIALLVTTLVVNPSCNHVEKCMKRAILKQDPDSVYFISAAVHGRILTGSVYKLNSTMPKIRNDTTLNSSVPLP